MTRYIKYLAIGIVASIGALLFISTQIDFDLFSDAWSQARYLYVVPCVVFLVVGLLARAQRWRILLNERLPYWRSFSILNVAYLINGFIPFRIGELARIWLASRSDPPIAYLTTGGTIIVERLLDLLAVVLMLAFALAAGPVPEWLRVAGVTSGMTALTGFLMLVFLSRRRDISHKILALVTKFIPVLRELHLETWLDHFLDGLLPLAQARTLLLAFIWTGLSWGFSILAGYILMFTFFEQASLAATCLYIAGAAFAIAVPAVPGNIGTYETAILLALSAVGYAENINTATAFAVTVHTVNVIVHATTGVIGFVQEGVSIDQLSQGVRQVTTVTDTTETNEIRSV